MDKGVITEVAFVWLECSVSAARSGGNDGMKRNEKRRGERERDSQAEGGDLTVCVRCSKPMYF